MAALPGCVISDIAISLGGSGALASRRVTASPTVQPLFVKQDDGSFLLDEYPAISATVSAQGTWSLTLPSQPNCDPQTVTWTITMPDGSAWNGPVTAAMVTASQSTPLSLHQLVTTYGWAHAATTVPSIDATTLSVGAVLIDQNPASGHPVALTVPRLAAPSGIASLDSAGHVPLGQISAITASQLSSSAGILGSQLSSSAGIVAGQIASVAASTLTGSHTLPDGVLSTNVPLLNVANTFTGSMSVGNLTSNGYGYFAGTIYTATINDQGGNGPYLNFTTTQLLARAQNPAHSPLGIIGAPSQAADLQQWLNSSGALQLGVTSGGALHVPGANGTLVLDDDTGRFFSIYRIAGATSADLQIHNGTIQVANGQSSTIVPFAVKGISGQSADLQQWQDSTGAVLAQVDQGGGITPTAGARITSGSGAPTTPGGASPTAGDVYHRKDTPGVAMQNIYICTVGGASPTWVGIV